MATMNGSIAALFTTNATYLAQHGEFSRIEGLLLDYLSYWNGWQIAATISLILVAYDQGKSSPALQTA